MGYQAPIIPRIHSNPYIPPIHLIPPIHPIRLILVRPFRVEGRVSRLGDSVVVKDTLVVRSVKLGIPVPNPMIGIPSVYPTAGLLRRDLAVVEAK